MAHQPILFKLLEKPVPIKGFAPLIPNSPSAPAVAAAPATHWDASTDTPASSPNWTLSGGGLTGTLSGSAWSVLFASTSQAVADYTLTIPTFVGFVQAGLGTASTTTNAAPDSQAATVILEMWTGRVLVAGTQIDTITAAWSDGDQIKIANNSGFVSFYRNGTLVGGPYDATAVGTALYPIVASSSSGQVLTGNFTNWGTASPNAYSLSCSTGTFSLTGANAAVTAQRLLAGSTSAYALTGIAASLAVGVPATRGVFALTGNPATITAQRKLTGATGAFALSGQSATLAHGFKISATTATFALTGYSVALPIARRLAVTTGAFVLTGNAAALQKGFTLAGATGQFTLTGSAAALKKATRFIAATGAFALTGSSATLAVSVGFSTGQFTLNGQAANLKRGLRLTASTGTFAITGNAATLTKAGINSYALTAAVGAFSLAGQPALLKRGLLLSGTRGAFTLTGYIADGVAARRLGAASSSFVIIGRDANLIEFSPNAVTYPLAGVDQPYPGGVATYPLTAAQDYPLDAAQTYPLADVPQQYPLAS